MRQTTIRFSDRVYQRLESAGEETGLPINSIVTIACLEWLETHLPAEAATPHLREMGLIDRLFGRRRAGRPDRFSPGSRRALAQAEEEARRFASDAIGPRHLLLALLAEVPEVRIDVRKLADEIRRVDGPGVGPSPDDIGLTAEAKRAIEAGVQTVRGRGPVRPEQLLLGLLEQSEIRRLLDSIGADPATAAEAIRRRLAHGAGDPDQG